MEEVVTIDGRQFKLTIDRPLTATERQQVIADIRKQTGCSTCGPRTSQRTLSSGGVYSLPMNDTEGFVGGGIGNKGTGTGQDDLVTLTASPAGGVRPYHVRFWRTSDGVTLIQTGITGATQTTLPSDDEGTPVAGTYTLTDADVAGATGYTSGVPTAVDITTGAITLAATGANIDAGKLRFYTSVVDSCPGSDKGTCAQYADVTLACVAPTCSFVVS